MHLPNKYLNGGLVQSSIIEPEQLYTCRKQHIQTRIF